MSHLKDEPLAAVVVVVVAVASAGGAEHVDDEGTPPSSGDGGGDDDLEKGTEGQQQEEEEEEHHLSADGAEGMYRYGDDEMTMEEMKGRIWERTSKPVSRSPTWHTRAPLQWEPVDGIAVLSTSGGRGPRSSKSPA